MILSVSTFEGPVFVMESVSFYSEFLDILCDWKYRASSYEICGGHVTTGKGFFYE